MPKMGLMAENRNMLINQVSRVKWRKTQPMPRGSQDEFIDCWSYLFKTRSSSGNLITKIVQQSHSCQNTVGVKLEKSTVKVQYHGKIIILYI